jgi:dTDP-4-amino-4,6-dideoxygalactose transaminase
MIPFNKPPVTGNEKKYVLESLKSSKISGDGPFSKKCQEWFNQSLKSLTLLTPSCTHALEMAAILANIQPGDEVIMPSYTFVSTANAFVLRGAKIVFVDIRPDTMNIDETKIEAAITSKTRAIVPVHYAGVSCEMDTINEIAKKNRLVVVEDAAQAMLCTYKEKPLGTLGDYGAFSFHETKNYTSGGEGGLFIINNEKDYERAEIIREKGTNRSQFFRGMTAKYTWVDQGSSYLMSDLQAAFLWGQLEKAQEIKKQRLASWEQYHLGLAELEDKGFLQRPTIPEYIKHNGHMYFVKVENLEVRTKLLEHLNKQGINSVFHYVPLHSSKAGEKFGIFHGNDEFTTKESERLLRLPMYYGLSQDEIEQVNSKIKEFFC